ncbi:MAG: hypothetical protein IPK60_22960 [Sandaracinaceae bacterium]|nr:hypothetical protein [Sandaracinaceae bacterium]
MGSQAHLSTAMVLLVLYQRNFVTDESRFRLVVKSRRIGFSFIVAYADVIRAIGYRVWIDERGQVQSEYDPGKGVDQIIISASMRQAKLFLAECVRHLKALEVILGEKLIEVDGYEVVRLTNGRVLKALPANPDTIRGETGDVTLDECQSIPRAHLVWAAAKAVANRTLGNRHGYRVNVCGTPLGDDNLFFELAHKKIGEEFSKHIVDIYRAIADGFPEDIESLRREYPDTYIFAQEFECQFLSSATRYISAEQYDACVFDDDNEIPNQGHRTGYAGMDVGRKSDGDPSVIGRLLSIFGTLWQNGRVEARKGSGWDDQEEWVAQTLTSCMRIALDATGMGNQFGERLVKRFGSRVDPVEFTVKSKEMLATGLKLAIERKKLRLRADDTELRRDVLSLRRNITQHGNVTYEAARTKDGHADRAWALALAVHTASGPDSSNVAVSVVGERTTNQLNKSW